MFDKLNGFTKKIADLPDKPSIGYSATQIKEYFDSAPEELRVAFNQFLTDLFSSLAAASIGAKSVTGADSNIQAVLVELKTKDDENLSYLLTQMQGIALGAVPDKSITVQKLAFDPATLVDATAIRKDAAKPLVVEVRTTDPSNPVVGQMWHRSDL